MTFWKKKLPPQSKDPFTPLPTPAKPADYDPLVSFVRSEIARQGGLNGKADVQLPEGGTAIGLRTALSRVDGWRGGTHSGSTPNTVEVWWDINTNGVETKSSGTTAWAPELTPRALEFAHEVDELREGLLAAAIACERDNFRPKYISVMGDFKFQLDDLKVQLVADMASYKPELAGLDWRVHRSSDAQDLLVIDIYQPI